MFPRMQEHYTLVRAAWLVSFLGALLAFATGGLAVMVIQHVLLKHGR